MILFLTHCVRAFLPSAVLTGLLFALRRPANGKGAVRPVAGALAFGLGGGVLLFFVSRHQETVTATRAFLDAAGILSVLLMAGAVVSLEWMRSRAGLFFAAALGAVASFSFLTVCAEQALSAVSVLNTDLLMNIGGVLAGFSLTVFLVPLTNRLASRCGRGTLSCFFLAACALLVIPWSAEVLLGLMRLEKVALTSARLTFVAKAIHYSFLFPYIHLALLAALALLFFTGRTAFSARALSETAKPARRKMVGRMRLEARWFKCALASIGFILAVFLHHDLYASRPPRISKPVPLTPDTGGRIRVRIDDVADGNLHRFATVTEDGHVVRFFLINRASASAGGRKKIGVVYDACMLCGDMGYRQDKNDVVCIACNVRIFVPSIGKLGGCNPIPLPHEIDGESIVIRSEELNKGAQYFSQVVDVKGKK
ncbi:MAG: DUF2318 domain-containing protein [Elusimicrobia bacterium]|nr:DUF2318 domain-containing protein [Elusimicrobiota bacterium]